MLEELFRLSQNFIKINKREMDCIRRLKRTNKPYTIPADFDITDYFKPGWHMVRYGEPVEVVLRFTRVSANCTIQT